MNLRKLSKFIFLFLFFITTSCGLKQPEFISEPVLETGSVFVNSNISGARIFVDYDSTGKVTPDTIQNLFTGSHVIQVFKDGYIADPDSITIEVTSESVASAIFSLEALTNQGKLFLKSYPPGAKILVDGSAVGKFTPDTLYLEEGNYQIQLYKNGFDSLSRGQVNVIANSLTLINENLVVEKQILIESFANSSCLPCTTTNTYLEDFISTNNVKNYSLIEHFTNWPNFLDPMFQHNPASNTARFTYYDVRSVPAMFIAGVTVDALNYISIVNNFNNQLSNASQDVSISLSSRITDSIHVEVELNEFNSLPAGNWRLFVSIIEKEVIFNNPPGSNGLKKFSHVFRKFLSPDDGDAINFINNKFLISYKSEISSVWDLTKIQLVGFIQNKDTKQVIKSSHL